jgi:hypothetical protein
VRRLGVARLQGSWELAPDMKRTPIGRRLLGRGILTCAPAIAGRRVDFKFGILGLPWTKDPGTVDRRRVHLETRLVGVVHAAARLSRLPHRSDLSGPRCVSDLVSSLASCIQTSTKTIECICIASESWILKQEACGERHALLPRHDIAEAHF